MVGIHRINESLHFPTARKHSLKLGGPAYWEMLGIGKRWRLTGHSDRHGGHGWELQPPAGTHLPPSLSHLSHAGRALVPPPLLRNLLPPSWKTGAQGTDAGSGMHSQINFMRSKELTLAMLSMSLVCNGAASGSFAALPGLPARCTVRNWSTLGWGHPGAQSRREGTLW